MRRPERKREKRKMKTMCFALLSLLSVYCVTYILGIMGYFIDFNKLLTIWGWGGSLVCQQGWVKTTRLGFMVERRIRGKGKNPSHFSAVLVHFDRGELIEDYTFQLQFKPSYFKIH